MITPLWPYPAALVKVQGKRVMIIADLHIGWEMALSEKGIHVPTQTPKLLRKLKTIVSEYKVEKLLILGDVKHTVAKAETGEWQDVPSFFNELKKHIPEICVMRGNHDGNLEPLLPEKIEVLLSPGIALGDAGFFHGHQWPSPALLKCKTLVMGHIHPVVALRDPAGFRIMRQVWVRVDCDTRKLAAMLLQKHKRRIERNPVEALRKHYNAKPITSELFIMPSFNDFLGGKPLNEERVRRAGKEMTVGPILRSDAIDMGNAELFLLDGTFLGTLKQLENIG
jgi:putative SbcD/Mre11-related phosphoesterase